MTALLKEFKLNQVTITDAYFVNALNKELAYLKRFEEDRLVAGFRETKGLKANAPKYPGWEEKEIRGHSLGHYLTAVSQAYAQVNDMEIKKKLDYIIDELEISQHDNGYLSAFPETLFDNVENKKPCWVPWYTMDKIIAGLIAAYSLGKNEKALTIVKKLGDWVYNRTSKWTKETRDIVIAVEYGGMNEALYQLYEVTGSEKHLYAAHMFDEVELFTPIAEKKDILNGKHANTTIPKFLGSLERYIALGCDEKEKFYFDAASSFWDIVLEDHTYVTGGNSEWEHFGEPNILDAERTNCNCETCNTYNMLKLSRELFMITKDKKYSDFYENTFLNAIMSSQNPKTGMTMYFQPMATGYFKVYSNEFDSFWCCTGTGLENFTKLNDSLYFHDDNTLYVNQFISSQVDWNELGMKLEQITDIPVNNYTVFNIYSKKSAKLAIRIPDWITGEALFRINDIDKKVNIIDGYAYIDINPSVEYSIHVIMNMKITTHPLQDNKHVIAMKYGPIVLSCGLGTQDMEESKTGVDVTIATRNINIKDFITIPNGNIDEWIANINNNVVRKDNKLEFTLLNTDSSNLVFTPHYKQHTQRYGIYWNFVEMNSKALQNHIKQAKIKARRKAIAIDSIPLGNDQYELLHNIKGENTGAGTFNGLMLRHAWGENSWFSYDMKVDPKCNNYLLARYFSPNMGRTFNIYINGKLLLEETIKNTNPEDFYDEYYLIPNAMINGKDTIEVKFATRGDSFVGGIFDQLCIVKDYDKATTLTYLEFEGMKLDKAFNKEEHNYTLIIDKEQSRIKGKALLANKNGLLYVNDILVDDNDTFEVLLSKEDTLQLVVYAEDFVTKEEYIINLER